MNRRVCLIAIACLFAIACSGTPAASPASATVTIVDAAGRSVKVRVPVQRVIAFNAFNVELIRAIGAFGAIVGMDEDSAGRNYEGYWGGFDVRQTVGRGQADPNWEQIVALKPDVVIFPRNGAWEEGARTLEKFGIPVVVLTGWDLEEHLLTVNALGRLFDRPSAADRLTAFYAKHRATLTERLRGVTPRAVFLENQREFSSPIPGSGWHDMITMGGGRNIFSDLTLQSDRERRGSVHDLAIDPEAVLQRDPEWVIKLTGGGYNLGSGDDRAGTIRALEQRPGWEALKAVRQRHIVVTSSFPMNACTKIIGALYLAKWLHPERLQGIDPDAVMREWIEGFQGVALPDPARYRLLPPAH